MKINTVCLVKKKSNMWYPCSKEEVDEVTNGFKSLYGDKNDDDKSVSQLEWIKMIALVTEQAKTAKEYLQSRPAMEVPYSKAKDYFGLSQRELIKIIRGENGYESLNNLTLRYEMLAEARDATVFWNRVTRLILFKKIDETKDWKDLSPISILPVLW